MILYFTGTGNSGYIARIIAQATNDQLYSINDGIQKNQYPETDPSETLVFVVPTYAWRIPKTVTDWICSNEHLVGQKAYFVLTCGGGIGNAQKYLIKTCRYKKLDYMGCAQVIMPENYIALYDCPTEQESIQIVDAAETTVKDIITLIQKGKPLPPNNVSLTDRIKSGVVNTVFYPLYVHSRKFYATEGCIGCGKCEKVCPLNNIHLSDCRPVWGDNCTHCMACICTCPTEAIEYGNNSKGKRRYRCPK